MQYVTVIKTCEKIIQVTIRADNKDNKDTFP